MSPLSGRTPWFTFKRKRRAAKGGVPQFTYEVAVADVTDLRVEHLEEIHEALVGRPEILGPTVGGNLQSGTIDIILTVGAEDESAGSFIAASTVTAVLGETGLAGAIARVTVVADPS